MTALALVSLIATANAEQALRAEQAAFVAVDEKRWCDAMALFVEANALAPTSDLIYNAARAAELANDRRLAVLLYTEVLGSNSKQRRRVEAKRKLKTITALVESEGPGTPCTAPASSPSAQAEATLDSILVAVTDPSATPAAPPREDAGQIAALTKTAPIALEPPGAMVARVETTQYTIPWSTVAFSAGGLLLVGGGVAAAFGGAPFIEYVNAQNDLRALEAERSPDVAEAYRRQLEAEAQWNGFGRSTVATGAAVMTAGALLVVAGGALLALEEDP